MSAILVRCDDIARTYGRGPSAVVAVHGVTCDVVERDRIAIVGPSGSGKSTLLHLMAGLEKPTHGTVSWPALGTSPVGRPGVVGMIFQGPSLVPPLDVVENVALPLILAGADADEAVAQSLAALELLQLVHLATQLPEELSGGQAQRVAVARVLAGRPRLILADEPTGQLDRESARHTIDVLLATVDELDAALVVSTHDLDVARRLDARWGMHDGRLAPTVRSTDVPDAQVSRS